MMKDYRIDGRLARVFVLKEESTDRGTNVVYIPVKSLTRTDYNRLKDIAKDGREMLKAMMDTKLDNGRNALVTYDSIIEVMRVTDKDRKMATRIQKPTEITSVDPQASNPPEPATANQQQTQAPMEPTDHGTPQTQVTDDPSTWPATDEAPYGFRKDGEPRRRPGPGPAYRG